MKFLSAPDLNANEVGNCADPTSPQSAATKAYVDARFPASSTDNAVARFDLATGKIIQNSIVTIDDAGLITSSVDDANNATSAILLALKHNTSGTPAIGLGSEIDFYAESSTTTDQQQAFIRSEWTVVTHASRTAKMSFGLENNATIGAVTKMVLFGVGGLSVGHATDPGAGIISANTGFWVGTAADSAGKYLRSDGAKFMAGTIIAGDLTTAVTLDLAFTAAQSILVDDATNSSYTTLLSLKHSTSGTPAIGLGGAIGFYAETSTTVGMIQSLIQARWSDVTHATRTAYLSFSLTNTGTDAGSAGKFYIFGSGGASLNASQDSGAGILYVSIGFQAGSTSPTAGQVLRSDGTKYVGSAIQTADLATAVASDLVHTALQSITITDSGTTNAPNILNLRHNSSGTPAANFGNVFAFYAKSDTTTNTFQAQLLTGWSTATHASRVSYMDFWLTNAAVDAAKMRLFGSGGLSVNHSTDPGAGIISANTGLWVGTAAPASGLHLISDGAAYKASAYKFPTAIPTTGYLLTSNGTDFVSTAALLTTGADTQGAGFATDTYITGSLITITAGDVAVGSTYYCRMQAVKTGAGVATPIFAIRFGTNGSTADTARNTFTFAAGTAVIDTGIFEFWVTFKAVGASAVTVATTVMHHNLTATGLVNTGTIPLVCGSTVTSAAFASSTVTKIGISLNAGTSASWTLSNIQAVFNK